MVFLPVSSKGKVLKWNCELLQIWWRTMIKPQARCVSLSQFSISKSKAANMSLILSLMNIIKLYQLGFLLRFCHLNGSCKNNNWIALGTTRDTHLFALLEKKRTNSLVIDSLLPTTWVLAGVDLWLFVIGYIPFWLTDNEFRAISLVQMALQREGSEGTPFVK